MPRESRPHWRPNFGCYTYHFGGVRHYLRGIAKGDTKGAEARAKEIREATGPRIPTIDELGVMYLEALKAEGVSKVTRRDRRLDLARFAAFVHEKEQYGSKLASDLTATDMGRFDAAMKAAGYAPNYRARFFRSVGAMMRWAARPVPDRKPERILEADPLEGIKRVGRETKAERMAERHEIAAFLRAIRGILARPRVYSPASERSMTLGRCLACTQARLPGPCRRDHSMTAARYRDILLLIRICVATGCRPGELCAARWRNWTYRAGQDADGFTYGFLRVPHKNQRHTGKDRTIVVPPVLARALERVRKRSEAEAIFTTHLDSPWDVQSLGHRLRTWRNSIIAAHEQDGTPLPFPPGISLYYCRHSWFSHAAPRLGAEVSAMLGGNSAEIVRQFYLHARPADLIDAASRARKRQSTT